MAPRRSSLGGPLLVAGVMVLSLNLRLGVAGVPPILGDLRARLGLSAVDLTVLTTLPVLCFGVLAPLAPALRRRYGEERVVGGCLAVLVLALLARAAWPGLAGALLPATFVLGGAIAVMNVLSPSLIKRRCAGRVGPALGLYTMMISASGALAAGVTVPVYEATGGSLALALGVWALPALVGLALWLPQLRWRAPDPAREPGLRRLTGRLRHSPLAWQVTLFMGLQSLGFYATLSWLPTLYRSRGVGPAYAGALLSIAGLAGMAMALVAPPLAHRRPDQRIAVVATAVLCALGFAGVQLAPTATAPVWVVVLGAGQGAGLGLALLFMVVRAPDSEASARLSGMAQSVGYVLAAAGPLLVGLVHAATGGWGSPIALLVALAGVQLLVGLPAARDRLVPAACGSSA